MNLGGLTLQSLPSSFPPSLCFFPVFFFLSSMLLSFFNLYIILHNSVSPYPPFLFIYSCCMILDELQVYNIVINNFKGYTPFIIIVKYWICSLCCTICPCVLILYLIVCTSLPTALYCPSHLPSPYW